MQQVAREQLDVLAQGVHGPGVLAERMVRLTEPEVRRDGQGDSCHERTAGRDRAQLSLGRPDGMLVVAHPPGGARVRRRPMNPLGYPSRLGRSLPRR